MAESLRPATGERLDGLEIGALGPADAEDALGVLARGMRDNPVHVAAFGDDPERRQERLARYRAHYPNPYAERREASPAGVGGRNVWLKNTQLGGYAGAQRPSYSHRY